MRCSQCTCTYLMSRFPVTTAQTREFPAILVTMKHNITNVVPTSDSDMIDVSVSIWPKYWSVYGRCISQYMVGVLVSIWSVYW